MQTKITLLSFQQNRWYYSSKTFAKCVGLVVQISCSSLYGIWTYFDDFNKKAFVGKKRTGAHIAMY